MGGVGNLTSADVSNFDNLGIGVDLLSQAGVFRATDTEARRFGIQYSATSDLSGIVFPYILPGQSRRVTSRLRRDNPDVDSDGKPQNKYILERGNRQHLYFPPDAQALIADVATTVVIVEAEKSVLAITAWTKRTKQSILAIGCGGCWGWRGKTGKRLLPNGDTADEKGPVTDFQLIQWAGREVVICFDANAASNDKVRAARHALATLLTGLGARVRIANVPLEPGINGPDDLIAKQGDKAMSALLANAELSQQVIVADAESAVLAITNESSLAQQDAALSLIAHIENASQRELLVVKFRKASGQPMKLIAPRIKAMRQQVEADVHRAAENARHASLRLRTVISFVSLT